MEWKHQKGTGYSHEQREKRQRTRNKDTLERLHNSSSEFNLILKPLSLCSIRLQVDTDGRAPIIPAEAVRVASGFWKPDMSRNRGERTDGTPRPSGQYKLPMNLFGCLTGRSILHVDCRHLVQVRGLVNGLTWRNKLSGILSTRVLGHADDPCLQDWEIYTPMEFPKPPNQLAPVGFLHTYSIASPRIISKDATALFSL
ncbi:hypothetical protein P170DRAFT_422989 [Aspergillus steynii IBT 23096]|uniref:Uncharacterized protein n=1 Tax=Aspergillus steynii IBT 23096 TaxID=1392250 RepID=A0A2I2GGW8_9EURO|nr:uncharacterized protein P170DRAFT_422989 [Aspergillus steynii IBT 23096]PLB52077.1 hypothetical protein P170DRAFT_422989 [Aspergillus steynii IBT 23096]